MQALGADDPRQVGGYRLLRRLGAGGMGRVYLGRTAGGRTVAVKLVRGELAEDAEFRARFRQEVAAARRVGGAWTAPVLDADTEGEHPWVATGYVAGPALGTAVRDFGPLPEQAVRTLGVGLAEALGHVHGLGLVHRDVKPSNVLLTLDGPRLIDFGIARALDATSGFTQSGYVVGSPGFMSPEQANGQPAGPPSDVFSLGAVLAFAATGVQPFGEGVSVAVLLYRVLHEEPDLSGLAGPLRPIVLDCLAKDPAARPAPWQLRERLDADGAATVRLGRGGWLPPALAAGVGRSAVELLDLEGEVEAGGAAAPRGPAAAPDLPGGRTPTDRVPLGGGPVGHPQAGHPQAGHRSYDDPPRDAVPQDRVPTGPERPGHRVRNAALVAVAVLLVLSAGGYGAYRGFRGEAAVEHPPTDGPTVTSSFSWSASSTSTTSSSTTSSSTTLPPGPVPPGTGGPSVVPAGFLGTWRGEMTTDKGLPAGTTTLVIGPAAVGQENTTSRNAVTGLISVSCEGAWTLDSASEGKLVFTSRLVRSSLPGACSGGSNAETLTLQKDGTIRFSSADPAAGNPTGTMRKAA
ncbi:serine/threonine protein kinase [Kitasatospora sp. NBC_01246]|uniref:serine/threonine-protein kinase n=1 Tax=Kitasatospora sp. NBC_01246 TaxID=2903570 RepID=UPI002E340027|nr:serine/threonine-protein kinase [Kitasatospora sp. NBC_01246]